MKKLIKLNITNIRFADRQVPVVMAEANTDNLPQAVQHEQCQEEQGNKVESYQPKILEEIPKDLRIQVKGLFRSRFSCPWGDFPQPKVHKLLNWKFNVTGHYPDYSDPPEKKDLDRDLPILQCERNKIDNPPAGKVQITWIGHSTVLVQLHGINILTDPVFCHTCGPVEAKHLGYERFREPSCTIDNLPKLDAVVISHDHFDHLDKSSVKKIFDKFKDVHWIVPKGIGQWLKSRVSTAARVMEFTWWEEQIVTFDKPAESGTGKVSVKFVCTPAQHWCGRLPPMDTNQRLWCTWVVKGEIDSFYFAGDTGYHAPLFQKIGELYGPISVAAIPIGAYEPRDITKYQQSCPIESVAIHKDVKAEYSIAIHWGAFAMTNEFFAEPPQFLKVVMEQAWSEAKADKTMPDEDKARFHPSRFTSLLQGQTWVVGEDRGPEPRFMDIEFDDKESMTMTHLKKEHYLDSAQDVIADDFRGGIID